MSTLVLAIGLGLGKIFGLRQARRGSGGGGSSSNYTAIRISHLQY